MLARDFFKQMLTIIDNNETPFRFKTGPYENVCIDKAEHIQKLNAVVKSDFYSVVPFNDGIFSSKVKFRKKEFVERKEKYWKSQRIFLLPAFSTSAVYGSWWH